MTTLQNLKVQSYWYRLLFSGDELEKFTKTFPTAFIVDENNDFWKNPKAIPLFVRNIRKLDKFSGVFQINWSKLSANRSLPLSFVKKYPDYPWNWGKLSAHNSDLLQSFTEREMWGKYRCRNDNCNLMELVMLFPNKDWDWSLLVGNESISLRFIYDNPKLPWNFHFLQYRNDKIFPDFLTRFWRRLNFSEIVYRIQDSINEQYVNDHLEYPWDWKALINLQIVPSNLEYFEKLDLNVIAGLPVSLGDYFHIPIPFEIILKYPDFNWNYPKMSRDKSLTTEILDILWYKGWDYGYLMSKTELITMEFLEAHPEIRFDGRMMLYNPNLTLRYVKEHPMIIVGNTTSILRDIFSGLKDNF